MPTCGQPYSWFSSCFCPRHLLLHFSGIKSVLTQIGAGNPIAWSSFLTVLLALCAYTIVFGRFFCGYACAFGTAGGCGA